MYQFKQSLFRNMQGRPRISGFGHNLQIELRYGMCYFHMTDNDIWNMESIGFGFKLKFHFQPSNYVNLKTRI